ncbi:Alpha/Beta hydrolase protein [Trichoderma sp. SZMC 28014]
MKAFVTLLLVFMALVGFCLAQEDEGPTVNLPGSQVLGILADGVDSFYGMPYAESPAGRNRLKRPVKRTRPLGDFDATAIAPACPQGHFAAAKLDETWHKRTLDVDNTDSNLARWDAANPVQTSEDCLSITVQRPAGTKAGDKLPVLFMLAGYSFVMGTPYWYNVTSFIKFGVEINQPFVLVTPNYRTGPWGFFPGKEIVKNGSSNLGLRDQRMSMEWASDNIAAFGGDPDKIVLWGHASGGVSVFDHLVMSGGNATYENRKLFRGAIMSSGSLLPAEPIDSKKCNEIFTDVAISLFPKRSDRPPRKDWLEDLREATYTDFVRATSVFPGVHSAEAMRLIYVPRPDNDLIRHSQEVLLKDNMFAPVPMIFGTQEDEGTIFAQKQTSVNNTKSLMKYLRGHYFRNMSDDRTEDFLKDYHTKPFQGSPYGTGNKFETWIGRKRLASVIGDVFFTIPRRIAMSLISSAQPDLPIWGYQAAYDYGNNATGALGTAHGSFEAMIFGTDEYVSSYATRATRRYLLNFLYDMDPNKKHLDLATWPKWTVEEPKVLKFNKSGLSTLLEVEGERGYTFMKKQLEMFRI